MWRLSTLISLICLIPIGSIVGLLTLFLLRGANGTVLTQVSGVVQVESPFAIAFACTLAALCLGSRPFRIVTLARSYWSDESASGRRRLTAGRQRPLQFDFSDACPSSGNLRLIRHFEKGGSGSSGVRV